MTKVFTKIMLKVNERFHNHQEEANYSSILQNRDEIKIDMIHYVSKFCGTWLFHMFWKRVMIWPLFNVIVSVSY